MKNLVLLGGGYGNMRIMRELLPNHLPKDMKITLVDREPYHCLKTEYYALAAGTVSDQDVRVSFPEHNNLDVKYGEITNINLDNHSIDFLDGSSLSYDQLVIGLGCEDKYHNVPGAEEFSYSIQTIEQSRETYQALNNLPAHSIVSVVGGGLSGIELASELRESRPDLTIKLFDRGPIILSSFPERISRYVQKWFETNGVDVINNANITRVEKQHIYNHDEPTDTDIVVWTAGIQPSKIVQNLPVDKDAQNRIVLTPHHNIPNYDNVYVVGDCASLPYAPSAQLAEGQGEQIVDMMKLRWANKELPETLPGIKLKGVLGSLGKKQGFGLMLNEKAITGRIARLLKSGVLWIYKKDNH